jgi:hypothetical protein
MDGNRAATPYEGSIILRSFAKYLAGLDDAAWNTRVMFVDYLDIIGCKYEGKNTYSIVNESRFAWEVLKYSDKKQR